MTLFTGSTTDPDDLDSVIHQAIGAGSVCWEHLDGTGVFQSDRAHSVAQETIDWIRAHYTERGT